MTINCFVCNGNRTAEYITKTFKVPHFGEVLETSFFCNACGYKHNDFIYLEQKKPVKYTLTITKNTLNSRIVKSQSATVSILELGLKVEPGSESIGYISNVEGVIVRFEEGVKKALKLFNNEESQKNALAILEKLSLLANGEIKATIIIEDPFGQSIIMDTNAKQESLTEEELKHLKKN
jgi:zinc finger protein